jgi:hypothetical protein
LRLIPSLNLFSFSHHFRPTFGFISRYPHLGIVYAQFQIDGAAFEKFLIESIKIEGKTGQLTDVLSVTSSGAKITVDASVHFSKRALKYLSKKFIKRISMSEYLKVVATAPNTYELKFRKEMEME